MTLERTTVPVLNVRDIRALENLASGEPSGYDAVRCRLLHKLHLKKLVSVQEVAQRLSCSENFMIETQDPRTESRIRIRIGGRCCGSYAASNEIF